MNRPLRRAMGLGSVTLVPAVLVAFAVSGPAAAAPSATRGVAPVCNQAVPAGRAACLAEVVTADGHALSAAAQFGLTAAQIRSAYHLDGASAHGRTVAVVDAYDDPRAEADLAVYRSTNGLPACTSADGCFSKVDQRGGTSYPPGNTGWGLEISLDLDAVSAACPDCHLLLVEADTAAFQNLADAVQYAATVAGVAAISNSYGATDTGDNPKFDHKGLAVVAATGDSGFGISAPASFTDVIAVGGTSLRTAANARGWKETAWSEAGSGCSTLNAKPKWQTAATQCSGKASADVSADADPNTGLSVYDTDGYGGFLQLGGTSLSAPLIAGVYAQGPAFRGYAGSWTWPRADRLYDITKGGNGSCVPAVWCTAGPGWDGPTGLGTPKGVRAF